MKLFNIKDMKMGWFIGDFSPTVLRTQSFEVAHHHYKKGFVGEPHYHKLAIEINYIVSGSLLMLYDCKHIKLTAGEIFIYEPPEISFINFLEDTDLIIIKTPSVPEDKPTAHSSTAV